MQRRLFDIGWSDESKCQACHKEEGTEKHRLYHCPAWYGVRRGIPEACGCVVVQLNYDVEMGPLHGMHGSMEAEYEVQRTINLAELTAFLCLLRKVSGPIKVHVDNEGIIDGLLSGEKEWNTSRHTAQRRKNKK